jgi:hypothetical protein
MAPEEAEQLAVLDLSMPDDDLLVGEVLRIRRKAIAPPETPKLEIYWNATPQSDDFWQLGDGTAFVRKNEFYEAPERMSLRLPLGRGRKCVWPDFSDALIMLLPPGFGAEEITPGPQAKVVNGRLALLFRLQSVRLASFRLVKTADLAREAQIIQSAYALEHPNAEVGRAREVQITVGDTYQITGGQQGAVGRGASVQANTFNQVLGDLQHNTDFEELADELRRLRAELKGAAGNADRDAEIGSVAAAERAARDADGRGVLENLARAGSWVLERATEIGTPIAAGAIKAALIAHGYPVA